MLCLSLLLDRACERDTESLNMKMPRRSTILRREVTCSGNARNNEVDPVRCRGEHMDRILAISLFRNASTNGQTCWRDEAGRVKSRRLN